MFCRQCTRTFIYAVFIVLFNIHLHLSAHDDRMFGYVFFLMAIVTLYLICSIFIVRQDFSLIFTLQGERLVANLINGIMSRQLLK